MADFNEDLSKKFLNYLDNKQFKRLQFEADTMGDVEKQHPTIMFYYASSIYLHYPWTFYSLHKLLKTNFSHYITPLQ